MEHDRREGDARIAVLETEYKFIAVTLVRIEDKLDGYNGINADVKNVCQDLKDHKSNHWQAWVVVGVVVAGLDFLTRWLAK